MGKIGTLCVLLLCGAPVAAQGTGPLPGQSATAATVPSATAATALSASHDATTTPSVSGIVDTGLLVLPLTQAPSRQTAPRDGQITFAPARPSQPSQGFQWEDAFKQYLMVLTFQHSVRMFQKKTYSELGGPFWADYVESVASLRGWADGDNFQTNYVAHPMMGAVTGYIQVQNDPAGRYVEFGRSGAYWRSRGWALAAATIYSLQFELGPMSEASLGNVGLKSGTMAYVDLVVTPLAGLGWIVAEDAVDRYLIAKVEGRLGPNKARLLRMFLNPNRSIANAIRFEVPWKRDARSLVSKASLGDEGTPAAARDRAVALR
jgi:hypothetical protein